MHNETAGRQVTVKRPGHRWYFWVGVSFLALVLLLGCLIFVAQQGWLRNVIGAKTSDQLGRSFAVNGPIHFGWDWSTPYVELNKLSLANLPNSADPNMVTIDQVNFHIRIWDLLKGQLNLTDLTLIRPTIILEKLNATTKNWDFPSLSRANAVKAAALPSKRSNFPIIGALSITDGTLTYRDKTLSLDTTLKLGDAKGTNKDLIQLSGQGELQKKPFQLDAHGGSLTMLRDSSKDYPLYIDIKMGATEVKIDGTFTDPVKMQGVNTKLDFKGDNLADLFYLTAIPLPPTPSYALSGQLVEHDNVWELKGFHGRVGQSDLSGDLTDDTRGERSFVKASILSQQLRMEDLRGFLGADTKKEPEAAGTKVKKVLPDIPINLTRLRASDMDVEFKAQKIDQPGWPIDNMDAHVILKEGILTITPLSLGVAGGTVAGDVLLDGQNETPIVKTDLTLKNLSLKPFFTNPSFESLSSGRFGGRFEVAGIGKSLAEVLGDGNGTITMIMSGGSISKLIADAAGLDAKMVTALLGKDQKTAIRCAITDFALDNGHLNSRIFVLDTDASKIDGTVKVNLKNETIDGEVAGHPKDITISGQIPITVTGPLGSPSIGLDTTTAAARGGAAAVLSAFLTPIAAILPFIDIDPASNSNCSSLIEAAKRHGDQAPPTPTVPPPAPAKHAH